MGIEFQMWRAAVNTARGLRHFQQADSALSEDDTDEAVIHLKKGLGYFSTANDHMLKAEEDAYTRAGSQIRTANEEIQKAISDYEDGKTKEALRHYAKAMDFYDQALDLIDITTGSRAART